MTRAERAAIKGQHPTIIWLTGLSGAGKSTIAAHVARDLTRAGRHVFVLDGDELRQGLSEDLGFTEADRGEHVRRIAHVARLMAEAGLIVLVSLISPFQRGRRLAREIAEAGGVPFIEVYVDTPLDVCEARDPKGLYRRARSGALPHFTGIGSLYEPPEHPDLHLNADRDTPAALAGMVLEHLRASASI